MSIKKTLYPLIFMVSILFQAMICSGAEGEAQDVPMVFLPTDEYVFEPTLEGTDIIHDFIIQNKGTAPLKIKRVKSG